MILRMMVLAFLLGFLIGCGSNNPAPPDEFLMQNEHRAKILAVYTRHYDCFNVLAEGIKDKKRIWIMGDLSSFPVVGDEIVVGRSKHYREGNKVYSIVRLAGKREQ